MQSNRIFIDKKKKASVNENITDIKKSVFLGQCEESDLNFTGKFNSLSADKCRNVDISVESLISSLELMNCGTVNVTVKDSVKHFQVDNCSKVEMDIKNPEGVVITHTGCQDFHLKLGEEKHRLPCTFVSRFEGNAFVHEIKSN